MATRHVRARCKTTGSVAALSEKALNSGVFPDWERDEGPVPDRPKPHLDLSTLATPADSESADDEEE